MKIPLWWLMLLVSLRYRAYSLMIQAKRVTDLKAAGDRLRRGDLVSFPTETVYGLGCNAFNEDACRKVFQAKERPLTDPLISHVLEPAEAYEMWAAKPDSQEFQILQRLCQSFWPGPLTIVAKAHPSVPDIVMANTGFCACRSPNHPVARELLAFAKVPVAAPSANKFGHVSPTTADHVFDDLKYEDVWIVENRPDTPCEVGVESSVAKLEAKDGGFLITVLRQGAVSTQDIEASLKGMENVQVRARLKRATKDHVANVAPGQTIRHYSPNVPSFIVSDSCKTQTSEMLQTAVVIDFGGRLAHWKDSVLSYRDLSASNLSKEAAQRVFDTLRWAEQVPNASIILFPDIEESDDALTLAVKDRLTRAASGVKIENLQDAEVNS